MAAIERMNYRATWKSILDKHRTEVEQEHPDMGIDDRAEIVLPATFKEYLFACYCDDVKLKHKTPWEELNGRKAAEMIAVRRHHWLPSVVAELDDKDLMLALHEELSQFKLSPEAMDVCRNVMSTDELFKYIEHHQPSSDSSEN